MTKNGLATLGALLVAVGAGAGCSDPEPYPGSFQGIIEHEDRVLGFQVGGRVEEVAVDRGQPVEPGQVLAVLDDSLEQTSRSARAQEAGATRSQLELLRAGSRVEDIRAAAAQLRGAQASERLLRKNLQREQNLFAGGAVPEAAVDDARARLDAAISERQAVAQKLAALRDGARPEEVDRAEAILAAAEDAVRLQDERLERFRLRAREDGAVLDVHVEPGEVVSPGTPVVTVADLDQPYADVFVPQGQLHGIAVGAPATVHVDATDERFTGRVEDVARTTEFTPRFLFSEQERPNLVIRVRVRIDDPEHELHAGVPAFVTIDRVERPPATSEPAP